MQQPTIPATMKAAVYEQYGAPSDVLHLQEQPVPTIQPHEVLIRIYASSVNPVDWKILSGVLCKAGLVDTKPTKENPAPVGFDASGVIVQVGKDVSSFQVGDEVFAIGTYHRDRSPVMSSGSLAEYFAVDHAHVAPKPKNLSHLEAASIPLVGLTSYQALFVHGKLQRGERILILGGSGGTGSVAIQLAHDAGAYVATTCSERNIDFVKSLGADQVVDYTKEDFAEILDESSFDMVYACANGDHEAWKGVRRILKDNGRFVSIVSRQFLPSADDSLDGKTIHRMGYRWIE